MQGQGFENIGGETLYWYGPWNNMSGVRVARWEQDRLGYLQYEPWQGEKRRASLISAPIATGGQHVTISLNASGLNDLNRFEVSVLDEQFRPLPGLGATDCAAPSQSGLRQQARWGARDRVSRADPIRVRVDFGGVRPEDIRLYAIYVTPGR